MNPALLAFVIVLALVTGYLLLKLVRYKGLRGMMFGGEVVGSMGEVPGRDRGMLRTTARVHLIRDREVGSLAVGLEIVHKGPLSYQMSPITLTQSEAQRLAEILDSASRRPPEAGA